MRRSGLGRVSRRQGREEAPCGERRNAGGMRHLLGGRNGPGSNRDNFGNAVEQSGQSMPIMPVSACICQRQSGPTCASVSFSASMCLSVFS